MILARLDRRAPRGRLGRLGLKVRKVLLVIRDQLVPRGRLGLLVPLARKVQPGLLALQALKAQHLPLLAPLAPPDLQALKALLVVQALLVQLALPVPRVQLVQLVHQQALLKTSRSLPHPAPTRARLALPRR